MAKTWPQARQAESLNTVATRNNGPGLARERGLQTAQEREIGLCNEMCRRAGGKLWRKPRVFIDPIPFAAEGGDTPVTMTFTGDCAVVVRENL